MSQARRTLAWLASTLNLARLTDGVILISVVVWTLDVHVLAVYSS